MRDTNGIYIYIYIYIYIHLLYLQGARIKKEKKEVWRIVELSNIFTITSFRIT